MLKWAHNESIAGGAANVAANIASLGASACVVGVVGDDEAANELRVLLDGWDGRLEADFCTQAERPTTVKTRFVTNGQQLLRLDQENTQADPPPLKWSSPMYGFRAWRMDRWEDDRSLKRS